MVRKSFMNEEFCLASPLARTLYHQYAENQPIIDYHCHLPAKLLAEDHRFQDLTEIWLAGDHYKWRAMRTNGVPEYFITGEASNWEKFQKWAETVPYTLRNPLYHWTHLELKKPFGITDRLLSPRTAESIWNDCNRLLAQPEFSAQRLIRQWNVFLLCTTDDPTDSLEYHQKLEADSSFTTKVIPGFRPDRGLAVEDPQQFNQWLDKLAEASGIEIRNWSTYLEALRKRVDFFHSNGGRISDHALEKPWAEDFTERKVDFIFKQVRAGKKPTVEQSACLKSALLYHLGLMYQEYGWTQQYHLGVMRNCNTRMMAVLGPDSGFDAIGDFELARPLAKLLDRLDRQNRLPQTILYNINPRDNELLVSVAGCFQGEIPGKIQVGSAWWFLDQKEGMEKQMNALSNLGLLSRFVGMVTDSRSFLSFSRHEYFRRILCNLLAEDVEKGLLPGDEKLLGEMVLDICYRNAVRYFGFNLPSSAR
ncbi:MAG: glucuronate isomerase [Candidatus Omnitrophica bacterium]|nr:glucuronate isomerase [Candidatus Omnitrophota bacterium]